MGMNRIQQELEVWLVEKKLVLHLGENTQKSNYLVGEWNLKSIQSWGTPGRKIDTSFHCDIAEGNKCNLGLYMNAQVGIWGAGDGQFCDRYQRAAY